MPTPQEIQDIKLAKFQADRRLQGTPAGTPQQQVPQQQQYKIQPAQSTGSAYGDFVAKNGSENDPNYVAPTLKNATVAPTTTLGTVPATTGTGIKSLDDFEANIDLSPGILTFEELPKELQDQYNKDPYARSQFDLYSKKGLQDQKNFLKEGLKTFKDFQTRDAYAVGQDKLKTEADRINQEAMARNQQTSLQNAKQNTGYYNFSSAPSTAGRNATEQRINDMVKTIDETAQLNDLGNQSYAMSVKENARLLTQSYQKAIGETYFNKLKDISAQIDSGEIKDEDQLYKIFQEASDAMLREVPALSNAAIDQIGALTKSFTDSQTALRENANTYMQNANKYNEEMSQVQGFAVDGNGQQILGVDGKPIEIPKEAPIKPFFDDSTGQFVTFTTDEYGTIIPHATKVEGFTPKPTAQQEKWKPLPGVPGKLYDPITGETKNIDGSPGANVGTGSVQFTPPTGFESRGAGQSVPVINTGDGIEIGIPSGTKLEGVGGWCGGFANDYGKNILGYKPVGDSFESKLANKNSDVPVAGGMAMWTPGKFEDNGHIGIVEKVFPDGSFQFYDTNYVAANTTSRRIIKPGDKEYNLIQKTGGFFDPTKVGGQSSNGGLRSLGQFMKDNQSMGPGYSEKDVERFDEKIDRFVAQGDTKSMAKAYREMLLRDTDFKKEFDSTQKFTRALDDVEVMINEYEQAGKSTNALKGMAEKVARKLGVTTDTALAQLQTQMGFTLANYIRSISGTAASDVEVQRLMGNMASIGNVKDLNKALVEQARNNATSSLKSMVDTRMYGLPEELKPQVFGDIYSTPNTSTNTAPQSTSSNTSNNNPLGI